MARRTVRFGQPDAAVPASDLFSFGVTLVAMLLPALAPRVVRKKTKPSKGAVRRRLSDKSAQGQKKAQRKVRHDD